MQFLRLNRALGVSYLVRFLCLTARYTGRTTGQSAEVPRWNRRRSRLSCTVPTEGSSKGNEQEGNASALRKSVCGRGAYACCNEFKCASAVQARLQQGREPAAVKIRS